MIKMYVGEIHYDHNAGAYQARVDIEREGHKFRYPCQVHGPEYLDMETVRSSLAQRALGLHGN